MGNADAYFQQLKLLVGNGDYYNHLLWGLFNREFYSPIELDAGRASYGLWLRKRYLDEVSCAELGPCRVLEMLIALAEQIDIHTIGQLSLEERIKRYFWMMIENLGLMGYTDYSWGPGIESEFNFKIDNLLDHRYGPNGEGSLFPLQEYSSDPIKKKFWFRTAQKDKDLWGQCCSFDIVAWEKRKGFI